jgi:hypothetical protein
MIVPLLSACTFSAGGSSSGAADLAPWSPNGMPLPELDAVVDVADGDRVVLGERGRAEAVERPDLPVAAGAAAGVFLSAFPDGRAVAAVVDV